VILELIPTDDLSQIHGLSRARAASGKDAQWFILGRSKVPRCPSMPAEITNTDDFVGLSETAHECRVKRSKDLVKLKLRTPSQLYTLKVKVDKADDVIKRLKCEIVEV
jgi:large subunit ribosomal protein L38e